MSGFLLSVLMSAASAAAAIRVQPLPAYSRRLSTPFSGRGFFVGAAFVGNLGWDPLNLATEETLVPLRHAELKHGRLAMLAAVGIPIQELVHPLLIQACAEFSSPKNLLVDGCFSPSVFHGGLSQPEVQPAIAFALTVGSAFELREISMRMAQGLAFNEWAPDQPAGMCAFDPLRISDDLPVTDRFELQEAEIINGRLACLALLAYAAIEGIMGVPLTKFAPDMLASVA